MLQPSVVEVVSSSLSTETPIWAAIRSRSFSSVANAASQTLAAPRPPASAAASAACMASKVWRESGPTEPALR